MSFQNILTFSFTISTFILGFFWVLISLFSFIFLGYFQVPGVHMVNLRSFKACELEGDQNQGLLILIIWT